MSNIVFSVDFIRKSWLSFFEKNGYNFISPNSLIPDENDKSLLWINSGVASLKKFFSSDKKIDFVNCQKVIRIEDSLNIDFGEQKNNSDFVYHQTLFEMLGIFSINSNFKEEAIFKIWLFFTSELNIEKKNLIITVWNEDFLVIDIWKKIGVIEEKIILGDKKTNFWDMGDGPCGPNTEIYFDFFPNESKPKNISDIESNSKRFIEICNLVFPEYYHNKNNNTYDNLGKKCVDVGAGLERIAMVMQKKEYVFEIDIWKPSIDLMINFYLSSLTLSNSEINFNLKKKSFYIIADHLRTIIFSLSDGAKISSKGRGYILKKLLKRICVESFFLSFDENIIKNVIKSLISSNSFFYPELEEKKTELMNIIIFEFNKYFKFLSNSNDKLYVFFCKEKNDYNAINIFFLYDTLGIPLKLINNFFLKREKNFPQKDFFNLLEKQKKISSEDRNKKKISVF